MNKTHRKTRTQVYKREHGTEGVVHKKPISDSTQETNQLVSHERDKVNRPLAGTTKRISLKEVSRDIKKNRPHQYERQGAKKSHDPKRHGGRSFSKPNPMMDAVKARSRGGSLLNSPIAPRTQVKHQFHKDKLRVIVVGGNEEVGRNCTFIEYENDIIVIDLGIQFAEENMPGIDYIIPNISYLHGREKDIKGVIITHGHLDHIGAIPHIMPRIGNPPIYATPLTMGLIQKRHDDFPNIPPLNAQMVKRGGTIKLGVFTIEFFGVSHNIPDAMGLIIHTPVGIIVHTGDFKIDLTPAGDVPPDMARIEQLGNEKVLALMADSTNASAPGHQFSETQIKGNMEEIFQGVMGRLIIGTFASNIGRVQQIITLAEKYKRKVLIQGYSMKTNIEVAHKLGHIKYEKNTVISEQDLKKVPDNQLLVVCTGAQGEANAVLMRVVNEEHRFLTIQPGDTVVFSSSVVPGNERTVQNLTDSLYRKGARVINYKMMDIHAGGHAKQEDLKLMLNMIKPKYLIPIEGNHSFLHHHREAAVTSGFPYERVFIADNGQVIEFDKGNTGYLTLEKVPSDYVFVDGLGVGDVSNIVLRDREALAQDGMFVVIAVVQSSNGRLVGSPDIISRGFIYMKDQRQLIEEARDKVREIIGQDDPRMKANGEYIKNKIRDDIGLFLYQHTLRRPMILPVIIEV